MHIDIEYNGAIAECRVTSVGYEEISGYGVPRYDRMTAIMALNAMQTIIKDYNRELKKVRE
jgi:hypothetical protein